MMNNEDVLYVGVDELCNRSNTYKGKKTKWGMKFKNV